MKALEVACDESGNDGENLFAGNATVFADASVTVSPSIAKDLMDEVRAMTRGQAPELKSSTLLQHRHRQSLIHLLTHPAAVDKVSVHLSEKRYFLVGKLVDLVVEELMHERGVDIYRDGRARRWARALYAEAPAQLDGAWDELLAAFNNVTRVRSGGDKSSEVEQFRRQLRTARAASFGLIANLLRLLDAGDHHLVHIAKDSSSADPSRLLDLHPVFAALGQAARTWHEKTERDIILVHDNAPGLTHRRGQLLIDGLSYEATIQLGLPHVPLRAVKTVDSKSDARVQLADLFAGVGREYAQRSLVANDDVEVLTALRPHLNTDSIWAETRSWEALMGYPLRD